MTRAVGLRVGLLSTLWGLAYLLIEVALDGFPPPLVVLARVALAALVLVPLAARRGAFTGLGERPWLLLGTVLLQSTLPLVLLTYGQRGLSAGLAGIITGSQPLFVAALSYRLDRSERPRGIRGAAGLAVGFLGLVGLFAADLTATPTLLTGGLLVTAAAACYALGSISLHRHLADARPLGVAATAMLVTTTALAVPGLLSLPAATPTLRSSAGLAALGLLCTALTLTLFYDIIGRAGPAVAALAFYLSPAVAVILGAVLLGEAITPTTAAGLAAVVAGSALASSQRGR